MTAEQLIYAGFTLVLIGLSANNGRHVTKAESESGFSERDKQRHEQTNRDFQFGCIACGPLLDVERADGRRLASVFLVSLPLSN